LTYLGLQQVGDRSGGHIGNADQKCEKTNPSPDFFIETLIATDEFDSEVRDLPEIIPFFSNSDKKLHLFS
jgi:hypothetical protein